MIERFKERLPLIRPLFVPLILYIGLLAFAMNWLNDQPGVRMALPGCTPAFGSWIVPGSGHGQGPWQTR